MKRVLYTIGIAALSVFGMSGCAEKTPKEMLVGTFAITDIKMEGQQMPVEADVVAAYEELKKSSELILNSDGTMVSTSNNITKKGNWELLGEEEKLLKLIYEDKGTTTSEIRNISNEGFMLVQPQPENTIITYKKK